MVEMRQRIDRADKEKEITEAIQVCVDADREMTRDALVDCN
jgi:hypothetical protein